MRDSKISELRRALRREALWGARADRLVEAWVDHVCESVDRQTADGTAPEEAEAHAWQALGTPRELASEASRQLTCASWAGRHPWFAGLVLPAFAFFVIYSGSIWGGMEFILAHEPTQTAHSRMLWGGFIQAANWLPWILSLLWIGRLVHRMPAGWKYFWIASVTLILCSTSVQAIPYDLSSSGTGPRLMFMIGLVGLPGLLAGLIVQVTLFLGINLGPDFQAATSVAAFLSSLPSYFPYPVLIKLGLSAMGIAAIRRWALSPPRVGPQQMA